jgi:alpha-mannosidase
MTLDVHIVSHTHWDREWYHPLERFQQRLVALIDDLLDDPPVGDESFLLDGQAIIIDDYLDVRPERSAEITALLRDRHLEAGPWYVLADELIPSGEALVRNLLAGRRALRRLGAVSPAVLYCPDSFGHPASLPAIAKGFGLSLIILWRGYGGPRWPSGDTIRWQSPAEDEAIVFHLPRDGYEFGSHLPLDDDGARARWTRIRAELAPRSSTGVTLLPHGADHHARPRKARQAIDALMRAASPDRLRRSSLHAFATHLVECANAESLPLVRGELRDSYGYTWTLQGTFATRAHEKRLNATTERLLVRESEPWAALASRNSSPVGGPLVAHAWRTLLGAHPHDTLCGCSIDEVGSAMELRIRSAANQGAGVRDDSIAHLLGHDAAAARDSRDRWTPIVVLRNPAARVRSGVAVIDVEAFAADVPVGPGSAGSAGDHRVVVSKTKPRVPELGAIQVLSRRLAYSRTESPHHYPDNDLVSVSQVAAWIADAPAYGVVSYPIADQRAAMRRTVSSRPSDTFTASRTTLRNAVLELSVSATGAVTITHVSSGRRIHSLLELLDERDVGDLYTPAPRERSFQGVLRGARLVHSGPLRGELAASYRIVEDARPKAVLADVTAHLTLDTGAEFLRISIVGDNRAENHRVRLALHSDVREASVWADAAFSVVNREPIYVGEAEAAIERPPATAPLHRYVSLFNSSAGMTLFSDGLAEYEARADGAILVTLVRGVGELSRNDLPERPGHAGWPSPTPAAQCLGEFKAAFGLMLHGPRVDETVDAIEKTADDVLNPLVGSTLRSALEVPAPVKGVRLVGAGLAFSAMKQSEDDKWIVLRCVNLLDREVTGEWQLPFAVAEAHLARLDETLIGDVAVEGRCVRFQAAPRAIVTVMVK